MADAGEHRRRPTISSCSRPSSARRGLRYRRVAAAVNGDVALPSAAGILVGLSDREAILAREDAGLTLANVQSARFANTLPIADAAGRRSRSRAGGCRSTRRCAAPRSASSAPTSRSRARRPAAAVQLAQAGELLAGPADTDLPVVLLGDFNARPGRPTYAALRAAGFDDAWTRANPDDADGFTCCHASRSTIRRTRLRARIDLILTRGAIAATEAFLVGELRRRAGLWPSDHAGRRGRLHVEAGLISTLVARCGSRSSLPIRGVTPEG